MAMNNENLTMSDSDFSKLRAIIHQKTGITIGETRKTMLLSRLRRRVRETEVPGFGAYIEHINSNPEETQELINCVTTNETYFFRTPRIWNYFRETFVPEFLEAGHNRPMRVWSGAASTGEEAHTIGVMLEETRLAHSGFDYAVLGTDISSRVLEIAEAGLYKGKSVSRFRKEDPELFLKHMHGSEDDGYRVDGNVKRRIKFKIHNLMSALKNENVFDVVFLRNVLIYFSLEDQESILKIVHAHMRPDGILFIGESETLTQIDTSFDPVEPLIYRPSTNLSRRIS